MIYIPLFTITYYSLWYFEPEDIFVGSMQGSFWKRRKPETAPPGWLHRRQELSTEISRFLPRSVLKLSSQHSETKLFETYLLLSHPRKTTNEKCWEASEGGDTYRKSGQQGTNFFQTRNPPVVSEELSASLQGNIYQHPWILCLFIMFVG